MQFVKVKTANGVFEIDFESFQKLAGIGDVVKQEEQAVEIEEAVVEATPPAAVHPVPAKLRAPRKPKTDGPSLSTRIVDLITLNGTLTPQDIANEFNAKYSDVASACLRLAKAGKLVKEGRGQYAVPQTVAAAE